MPLAHTTFAAACAALGALAAPAIAKPPVFTGQPYAEAKAAAERDGKLFIVDATAEWCGPCKIMDRTTWIDPAVVKWIGEHAVAVQVDVDEQPEISESLKIRAMPTVVVFREGKEFDRAVGLQQPGELLSWLDNVKQGRSSLDALREAAGERADANGQVDVHAQLKLARSLMEDGDLAAATEEYVWLWNNMLKFDLGWRGVRLDMVDDVERLAARHGPAARAFAAIRDEAESRLRAGTAEMDDLDAWAYLSKALHDHDRILAWHARVKDDPEAATSIHRVSAVLHDVFTATQRWEDLGRLHAQPVRKAREDIALSLMEVRHSVLTGELREALEAQARVITRERVATLYAACLFVDREREAAGVAESLLARDNAPESHVLLVEKALEAGEARPVHRAWLDEAEEAGLEVEDLRARLDAHPR